MLYDNSRVQICLGVNVNLYIPVNVTNVLTYIILSIQTIKHTLLWK